MKSPDTNEYTEDKKPVVVYEDILQFDGDKVPSLALLCNEFLHS